MTRRTFLRWAIALLLVLLVPFPALAAGPFFWVGGTGNTSDSTNHWATISGGAPNVANVPDATSNCIFDTLSHTAGYTVTANATLTCLDFTTTAPLTGNLTFTGASQLNVAGSMSLYSGMVWTKTGTTAFTSTTTGKTINTNGTALGSGATYTLIFNGVGGGWTFASNVACGLASFTAGSVSFGGFGFTNTSSLSMTGSAARAIDYSGSTWDINGNAIFAAKAFLTLTGNGSSVLNLSGGNLNTADQDMPGLVSIPSYLARTLQATGTFVNLTITTASYSTISGNITVTGTFSFSGFNDTTGRGLLTSGVPGTQRTITSAANAFSNADFQDIVGAGAGSWNLSAITGLSGDGGGNSGITLTTPQTNYWVGGTGSFATLAMWANASGGSASSGRVPLIQDTARIDANSGGGTITQNMQRTGAVDFTGSPAVTFTTSTAASLFGSLTLVPNVTLTGSTQAYTLAGRGSQTVVNAGKSWAKAFTLAAATGDWTFLDDFVTTGALTVTSGHLYDGGNDIQATNLASTGTLTRSINAGTAGQTWTFTTGTASPVNLVSTGLAYNRGTETIRLTGTLTADRSFIGGGQAFFRLENATVGAFALQIVGSNTFLDGIYIDASAAARTVQFTAGSSTTVGNLARLDATTNIITIGSITAAGHSLVNSGAEPIRVANFSISRSTATWAGAAFHSSLPMRVAGMRVSEVRAPTAARGFIRPAGIDGNATFGQGWFATSSTDGGNNSGWVITP